MSRTRIRSSSISSNITLGNVVITGTITNSSNVEFIAGQGAVGYTGSSGIQGVIGYTGSLGYTGSQGSIGYTGSAGQDGTIGQDGYTGSQGIQGITGYTGSAGLDGNAGSLGYTGSQGLIGYTGSGAASTGKTLTVSTRDSGNISVAVEQFVKTRSYTVSTRTTAVKIPLT